MAAMVVNKLSLSLSPFLSWIDCFNRNLENTEKSPELLKICL